MTRTFIVPTAVRQADPVQDIYLRELKAYKSKPESLANAEGQVKKWSPPNPPPLPESANAGIAQELSAYESEAVEVEGQEAPAAGGTTLPVKEDDWFEEEATFGEKEAHH